MINRPITSLLNSAVPMAQEQLGYTRQPPMMNVPVPQIQTPPGLGSLLAPAPQQKPSMFSGLLSGPGSSARYAALAKALTQNSATPMSFGQRLTGGLLAGSEAAQEAIKNQAALLEAENEREMRRAKEAREASKEQREQTKFDFEMKESEAESVEKIEKETKKEADKKFNALSSLDSIKQAEDILNESPFLSSGLIGQMTKDIEASPSGQLESLYDSIGAKLGFDQLQIMRENSPTGGALGQVSDTENKLLKSTIASLKTGLPKDQQLRNLEKIKQHTAAIIYGAVDKDGNVVKLDTEEKVYKLMNGELKVNIPSQATSARVITREQLPK
jgi:hypothetical protein